MNEISNTMNLREAKAELRLSGAFLSLDLNIPGNRFNAQTSKALALRHIFATVALPNDFSIQDWTDKELQSEVVALAKNFVLRYGCELWMYRTMGRYFPVQTAFKAYFEPLLKLPLIKPRDRLMEDLPIGDERAVLRRRRGSKPTGGLGTIKER